MTDTDQPRPTPTPTIHSDLTEEERKVKFSRGHLAKPVILTNTGEYFPSVKAAADETGVNIYNLRSHLNYPLKKLSCGRKDDKPLVWRFADEDGNVIEPEQPDK